MLPDVAVTVTVEVPGATGAGVPAVFAEPPHPVMATRRISRDIEPLMIAIDLENLRRFLQIGTRPAKPSGNMALVMTMRPAGNSVCAFCA